MNRRALPSPFALLILCAVALTSVGCSEDSPTGPSNASFTHAEAVTVEGLELTVSTAKASVAFGDDFQIRTVLTNVSDKAQMLDFYRGNPARFGNLSVNVNDTNDLNHYAQSDGERDQFELAAGASITSTFTWNQYSRTMRRQVDSGVFEIIATVNFDDRDPVQVRDLYIEID